MSGAWFLTADADRALARSPMHRLAAGAGASFERRDGWEFASAYPGSSGDVVSFADRSHLVKLELHAAPPVLARIVAEASGGPSPEPGTARRSAGTWWCPVTPGRMLVLSEPDAASPVRVAIDGAVAAASESTVSIVDVTSGLAALALIGRDARELLARFCAIDVRAAVMPLHAFRPGSVARTPGYVLKEAEDRLLILFGWAFGEYLWGVVADAAEHLGGGPIGDDALRALVQEPARA